MEINTNIDEVVCTSVKINALGFEPVVDVSFGYLADGVRCGEVSYQPSPVGLLGPNVQEKVEALIKALEEDFVQKFGTEKGDEPREIEGLVKEF